MLSHASIGQAREVNEPWNEFVAPERQTFAHSRTAIPGAEYSFGAAIDFSVSADKLNSRLKTFDRDILLETAHHGLKWGNINPGAQCLLPTADPTQAKVTFAVIHQEGFAGRRVAVN
jgi:hypothetical protein